MFVLPAIAVPFLTQSVRIRNQVKIGDLLPAI